MQISFYKTSNAPNEYPKTFDANTVKTKDCTLLEPTSTKRPTIKLEKDDTLKGYTHAVIWGDIYALENDFTYDKGYMYINCVRSATDTHWAKIEEAKAHIIRSYDSGDPYIVDDLATRTERIQWTSKDIGEAFQSGNCFILIKGTTG